MPTIKRRLNITLSDEVSKLVTHIAKRDRVPEATKVSELVNISLLLMEDKAFAMLAEGRLQEKSKKISHREMWSK